MQQEDYNAMMRYPWERLGRPREQVLPECPMCGEKYLSDGVSLCADCLLIKSGGTQNTTKDDQ